MMYVRFSALLLPAVLSAALAAQADAAKEYFKIAAVDEGTGRGVPLVELRTVNGIRCYTDSNGVAAFREPGLMGKEVFFFVTSHGYSFPKDGFGFRGKKVRVVAGGTAQLSLQRLNIAERLYRVTGGGIYRDSILLGAKVPLQEPVLNGQVAGSDSVLNAVYRGKLYWFWGDTNRPSYPLGNFHVPGAVSKLPGRGGLDPEVGVELSYFLDGQGFAKPTMQMPGKGPTWMTALVPLCDREGHERLYASYVKVEPPLKVYARGLAVFDDARKEFSHLAEVDMKAPAFPSGHAFFHRENGMDYVYFAHPFPVTRVRATADDFQRVENYETFTCLKQGTSSKGDSLDRDDKGGLRYAWRKNCPALGPKAERDLIARGKIKPDETRWQLRDRDSGRKVLAHSGSVYWNAYRQRWLLIAVEAGGTSFLGEVWYAEADTPTGPWTYAVKVVRHDRYSFYNPKQHPMFDKAGGRIIFFEGTYTHTFSGNTEPTPRYDYNQIMYRLDLADSRLALPVPVYDVSHSEIPVCFGTVSMAGEKNRGLVFFAPDRPLPGTVPVLKGPNGLRLGRPGSSGALFYAVPPDAENAPPGTVPLYEFRREESRAYSLEPQRNIPGFMRSETPLCRVWK
jgi:hypothetical protein